MAIKEAFFASTTMNLLTVAHDATFEGASAVRQKGTALKYRNWRLENKQRKEDTWTRLALWDASNSHNYFNSNLKLNFDYYVW